MEKLEKKVDLILHKLEKLDNLQKSVDFLSGKYEELKDNIKRTMDNQDYMNTKVTKIKKEQKEQDETITILKQRITFLERQSLEETINFYPLLEIEHQNLHEVLKKIGDLIGIQLDKTVILKVFRRNKKKNGNPGEVVVKCASSEIKQQILEKVKQKKLMNLDLGYNCALGRIYCNEELTKEGKDIYFTALKTKKEKKWKYLWVKGGKIFVKKEEGGITVRLDSMDDFLKII